MNPFESRQGWCIEADMDGEFLRLKLFFMDLHSVPRNHLRYISWIAYVIARDPKHGIRESIAVANSPHSNYYIQVRLECISFGPISQSRIQQVQFNHFDEYNTILQSVFIFIVYISFYIAHNVNIKHIFVSLQDGIDMGANMITQLPVAKVRSMHSDAVALQQSHSRRAKQTNSETVHLIIGSDQSFFFVWLLLPRQRQTAPRRKPNYPLICFRFVSLSVHSPAHY